MNIFHLRPDLSATQFTAYEFASLPRPEGDLWVFGYGSLMWAPGFSVQQTRAARLYGYHRRLCLWSIHYRGTAKCPGLVLGLARGGSCNGLALRVAKRNIHASLTYLMKREMLHNAYLPVLKNVYLRHGKRVQALTFISRPEHPQFAPLLSIDETVGIVLVAAGKHGKNCDYVINTAQHLSDSGIEHTEIHVVAEKLQSIHSSINGATQHHQET